MKKIITGATLIILLSYSLYADCTNDLIEGRITSAEFKKCRDGERRNTLSPEERAVEDLERGNRLKQRQIDAQREKERLERELEREKEFPLTGHLYKRESIY